MCQSPNISVARRTAELACADRRRASSLQWLLLNGALLAVLLYDLCVWCGAWCGALACAEALCAAVLAGNCATHAARLGRAPPPAPAPAPAQRRLPALPALCGDSAAAESPPGGAARSIAFAAPSDSEPGSLSPARSWRSGEPSPPSPPSPPHRARAPPAPRAGPDEFIADGHALAAYIRQAERRDAAAGGAGGAGGGAGGGARVLPAPPCAHQLSVPWGPGGPGAKEPAEEESAADAPPWRRLHVDPRRLTEYNLNLRLWLHVTVVARVARELAAHEAGARAAALQPFLAPFADTEYVAKRIQELSRGGCLSAYRGAGAGGRGWRADAAGRPCDAELLLHLFAAYVDRVAAGGGAGFSARHLSSAPAPRPAAPRAPVLRRESRRPPHYVVLRGAEVLSAGAGRNNLLHALLLLLAAAAAERPPALARLHLGPAGLNMLWILGR